MSYEPKQKKKLEISKEFCNDNLQVFFALNHEESYSFNFLFTPFTEAAVVMRCLEVRKTFANSPCVFLCARA